MKKLLIDCSFIATTDLNTGIQRTVRKVIENIQSICEEDNFELHQVILENGKFIEVSILDNGKYNINLIPEKGDILLLVDSTWHLDTWESIKYAKMNDVSIISVIYDLIPISHSKFCDDNLVRLFIEWFDKAIDYVDGFIAISNTVKLQLIEYIKKKYPDKMIDKKYDYFLLGADFDYKKINLFSNKIRKELQELYYKNKNIYLIVCTVEPRKNHIYLLNVFEKLWSENIDVTLNIVGKIGWKVDGLIEKIYSHKEYNKRLFHWKDLNDIELNFCYKKSKALLFPSYIEGFGLPIVESLNNKLPVLASDIPIHREVGQDKIAYFDIDNIDDLVIKIKDIENKGIPSSIKVKEEFKWISWDDSTKILWNKTKIMHKDIIKQKIFNNINKNNNKDVIGNIAQQIIDFKIDKLLNDEDYLEISKKIKGVN